MWKYEGRGQIKYGHPESYARPAAWFDEVGGVLEDWGCGCCGMKEHVKVCQYIGIDGSRNDYADKFEDLRDYKSECDCILLRGVIDHNEEWEKVLTNAISSFKRRMVVMIFHDLGPRTKVLFRHTNRAFAGVPDLQFSLEDLMRYMLPYLVKVECIPADGNSPNNETLFYLEKP